MRKMLSYGVIRFTCVHKTLGKATTRLFSAVVEDFVKLEAEVQ
jgi:hypothetical protein